MTSGVLLNRLALLVVGRASRTLGVSGLGEAGLATMSASILQARHDTHGHGSGLTEAEQLETLRDPYASSPKYAWITAVVIGSIIAFFGLANLSYQLRRRYPGLFANSWYARKKTAAWRYLASKQQRLKNGRWFQFPVLGAGLIMLAFFLFMFGEYIRAHHSSSKWASRSNQC